MIEDRFGALIQELSSVFHIPISPDAHNACRIEYPDSMSLTLEPDPLGELLMVVIEISKPGDGKFRENILKEALRSNGLPFPRIGTFCYSHKKEFLLLTEQIPFEDLSGQRLFEQLESLLEKGRLWKESIEHGELPPIHSAGGAPRSPGGIFGL